MKKFRHMVKARARDNDSDESYEVPERVVQKSPQQKKALNPLMSNFKQGLLGSIG